MILDVHERIGMAKDKEVAFDVHKDSKGQGLFVEQG